MVRVPGLVTNSPDRLRPTACGKVETGKARATRVASFRSESFHRAGACQDDLSEVAVARSDVSPLSSSADGFISRSRSAIVLKFSIETRCV